MNSCWNLLPLTPKYIETEHGGYVSALEEALKDERIHNIALSGAYGAGKSSILRELGRRLGGRVVELSLLTLSATNSVIDDDVNGNGSQSPTNHIQREIVKQLLYQRKPNDVPASRFRRIQKFQWWNEVQSAFFYAVLILTLLRLIGLNVPIIGIIADSLIYQVMMFLLTWAFVFMIVLIGRFLLFGKLRIKQFSAGPATVTLDEKSVSYFDQYLDEIVYFFEESKCDVVIFEDIDRFNDLSIFETLRSLNTLLNACPQIKKPIRFIYAIKDSIFDIGFPENQHTESTENEHKNGSLAQGEGAATNRTKFFDLIIPVVPFITHLSARNFAAKLLEGTPGEVAPGLLDLATRYIPDMRLLKNACNEFVVFCARILPEDHEHLALDHTELFAMMLFKSMYPSDFEQVRLGTSKLDEFYHASRKFVAENSERIEGELQRLQTGVASINQAEARAQDRGNRLLAYIERVKDSVAEFADLDEGEEGDLSLGGETVSDVTSVQFWEDFDAKAEECDLKWESERGTVELRFSRKNVTEELGERVDTGCRQLEDKLLEKQIQQCNDDLAFLRGADFRALIDRTDFSMRTHDAGENKTLDKLAREILNSEFSYQLVRLGFIGRNFTLYTSTFHDQRVSLKAMNFMIHHVEPCRMDVYYDLDPADVDSIVRECEKGKLKEPGLYNINILERLLNTDADAAEIMISSLKVFGEEQRDFLCAFLNQSEKRVELIKRFSAHSSKVLQFLLEEPKLSELIRIDLANVVLENLPDFEQELEPPEINYLSEYYEKFNAFKEIRNQECADRVARLLEWNSAKLPSLKSLSTCVLHALVSRDLYQITYENLLIAIEEQKSVALDVIKDKNQQVYHYVLKHLDRYLSEVSSQASYTVDSPERFIAVLADLVGQDSASLTALISKADPGCRVNDLSNVSKQLWQALASDRRFPETYNNLAGYIAHYGVDEELAGLLHEAERVTEVESCEEDQKLQLAAKILAVDKEVMQVELRVTLVNSLKLNEKLDVELVPKESGMLYALLLNNGLIDDSAESYEPLLSLDWESRRAFILASKKFVDFMQPDLVQKDVVSLLRDRDIDAGIKNKIAHDPSGYIERGNSEGMQELARVAAMHEWSLSIVSIVRMAEAQADSSDIVRLLQPILSEIEDQDLFWILRKLDGDYPNLSTTGRKTCRVPDTPADRALLEHLKGSEIVSTYQPSKEKMLKVYRRRQ